VTSTLVLDPLHGRVRQAHNDVVRDQRVALAGLRLVMASTTEVETAPKQDDGEPSVADLV
jgi:hypothetical protein